MAGLIGIKQGMTQLFNENGDIVPVTVIKIDENVVVNKRLEEKDGYNAIVIGTSSVKEEKVNKPYRGQFIENIMPQKYLKEFRGEDSKDFEVGQKIGLEFFADSKYIDVIGVSKGKGFQGVMKRHGFHGGRKTHGSKFHRQNGSTGQAAFPSRVIKGVKRAGRMGTEQITVQNLQIVKIDNEKNVIAVKGCIPGNNKGIVYLRKAIKKS